jgi:hypothetical protein
MMRNLHKNPYKLAAIARRCAVVGFFLGLLPVTASADGDLAANWEGGPSNGYAAASPTFNIPLTSTSSLDLIPTGSYLYYDVHENGGITKVHSPGASFGADYKYSDDNLTFAVGPAVQVLWQGRTSSKGPKTNSTLTGWAVNGDLSYRFSDLTSFDLSSSYEQADRYYFTRASVEERVGHMGSFSWFVGPEGTIQGNNQFTQLGGGALSEFVFNNSGTSLQIRGGYANVNYSDHTSQSRPYVGVALDQRF